QRSGPELAVSGRRSRPPAGDARAAHPDDALGSHRSGSHLRGLAGGDALGLGVLAHPRWRPLPHRCVCLNRPGFAGGFIRWEDGAMAGRSKYSAEVRERAVRMVLEQQDRYASQWEAICSIAGKLGCSDEALRKWVRRAETGTGKRAGVTSDERERLKQLERENLELRRANEILRKASAYFAQAELDRRPK